MADRFNWGDDDSIVIQPVAATAVYVTSNGSVCIRQKAGPDDECDAFVIIHPRDATALVLEIRSDATEAGSSK